MNKLKIDQNIINDSRQIAKNIARNVFNFIDKHTTVSVERASLRLLGIDGVDFLDVPLVNVIVDEIKKHGDLSKGVLFYIAHMVDKYKISPQEVAIKISNKEIDIKEFNNSENPNYEILKIYYEEILNKIKEQTNIRLKEDKEKASPLKYVIVATGNIFEDVKQAISAAKLGADVIAVIRTTGQSLLDYVPYGETLEGFGGTYATQENFKIMRKALDEVGKEEGRYIKLVNYASGLCMPEIAAMGAIERLDMMLNDSMYGIIFRDINMKRTFVDQYFSRVLSAYAKITINTGEDNYLTTADAYLNAHTVLASQFINEQFAKLSYMEDKYIGLGHAYEIDPLMENSFLYEYAQSLMAREIFPNNPLKYMPPTKHMTGDIFMGTIFNTLFNINTVATNQTIHLLGMMTEAIHTPFISDRALALKNANIIEKAFKDFSSEFYVKEDGIIQNRVNEVINDAHKLLAEVEEIGLFEALNQGMFADVKRNEAGGKGLDGVILKNKNYKNPIIKQLIEELEVNYGKN
mgnify:CR=1 FL=1